MISRGFLTTDSDFALRGTDDRRALKRLVLTGVATESEWYHLVVKANECVMSYFLKPLTLYSPISNVVFAPRTGVKMRYQEDTGTLEYSLPLREHVDLVNVEEPDANSDGQTNESSGSSSEGDDDDDEEDHPVARIGDQQESDDPVLPRLKEDGTIGGKQVWRKKGKGAPPKTTAGVSPHPQAEAKEIFAPVDANEFLS